MNGSVLQYKINCKTAEAIECEWAGRRKGLAVFHVFWYIMCESMAKRVILPSRALPACVLVLLLTADHYCCTSESGYCEADGNCPLQNADNGDVQAVPDDRQYSVVSYISGAVGSLLQPLKNVIMKTIDEATKIAYQVWIVGIEELHKATKDYIPAGVIYMYSLAILM